MLSATPFALPDVTLTVLIAAAAATTCPLLVLTLPTRSKDVANP
jgi:hypothetical protein